MADTLSREQQELYNEYLKFITTEQPKLRKAQLQFYIENKRQPAEGESLANLTKYSYDNLKFWEDNKIWQTKLDDAGITLDGNLKKDTTSSEKTDPEEKSTLKIDSKKVEKISDKWKKNLQKTVSDYFSASEKLKNTPTEEQAVSDLNRKKADLIPEYRKSTDLNEAEYAAVLREIDLIFDNYVREQYENSIKKKPREVNNKTPYILTKDQKKELKPYIKNAKNQVKNEVQSLFSSCAQTGKLPSETQMSEYITGCITRAVQQNRPEDITEDGLLYMQEELEALRPDLMRAYNQYASSMKVTNSFPTADETAAASGNTQGSTTGVSGKQVNNEDALKKINKKHISSGASEWVKTNISFSGCDMVVTAAMHTTAGERVSVTLGVVQTISYSIYRKLSPILNIGNINAKDYVGGPRTIAGSLVFTVFNQHWGTELIDKFSKLEGYPNAQKVLMDELAPIDLTIAMANEYGYAARLALYSVRLFSEGQVMSINDAYTENTYQYVALNIDYLIDIDLEDSSITTEDEFS